MPETYIWIAIGLICLALALPALGFVLGVIYHFRMLARHPISEDELQRAAAKWARARRDCIDRGYPTWEEIEAGLEDHEEKRGAS